MQTLLKKSILSVAASLALSAAYAEEAIVTEGKINVRGQPSLMGEVVTQLQKGDKVTVLERVKNETPKPGEPADWAKIKLPQNTPVWVFSPFVKDGVVSATRLNLRGGPGENYSVVGRLERGASVKAIRTIEEWMEIEAPEGTYAFVDAGLLKSTGAASHAPAMTPAATFPAATSSAPATPTNLFAASGPTPPATAPAQTTPRPMDPFFTEVSTTTSPAPANVVITSPSATPSASAPAVATSSSLPPVAPAATTTVAGASAKRVVRRDGIVRPTRSIQAPTWYELVHPESKVVLDYLHENNLGINLKGYKGQRVFVTGEEVMDPRWPGTPILMMQTLDFAP